MLWPIIMPLAGASSGYAVNGSGDFDGSTSQLTRSGGVVDSQETFCVSLWVKFDATGHGGLIDLGESGSGPTQDAMELYMDVDNTLVWQESDNNAVGAFRLQTSTTITDTSNWHHIYAFVDTTQAVAGDRAGIFIDGVEASYSTETQPSLNDDINLDGSHGQYIGSRGGAIFLDGHISELVYLDGSTPGHAAFRSAGGAPLDVSGLTFGSRGTYLAGQDVAAGTDSSGNSLSWTDTGDTVDASADSPTD